MDHKTMQNLIYALHDGELDPLQAQQAQAHLKSCGQCQNLLMAWKNTSQIFAQPENLSQVFVQNVMNQVKELPLPPLEKPFWSGIWIYFSARNLALASAFVLMLAVVFKLKPQPKIESGLEIQYMAELFESREEVETETTLVENYFL